MERKTWTFTRQDLYELVWNRPGRDIASDLGISDVALSKACRRSNIPRPGPGYWAKQAVGKRTVRPTLPLRGLGQSDTVRIGGSRYWMEQISDEQILNDPTPEPPRFAEDLTQVTERARILVRKVAIPANISRGHPLVVALLEEDAGRRERQQARAYPSTWDAPRFDSPSGRRKLRILNALFLGFARLGHKIRVHVEEDRQSAVVWIGDRQVSFHLESANRKAARGPRVQRERLRLAINWYQSPPDVPLSWEDYDQVSLESQITDVAVGILVAAEWSYRVGVQRRHDWRVERRNELEKQIQEAKEEAERKETERLATLEKARRDQLLTEVTAWQQAADIRRYIEAVRATPTALGDPQAPRDLEVWTSWALAEADRLDPLYTKRSY